jgi:hypothetical protein
MRKMALFVVYMMLTTSFTSIFSIQCIALLPGVPTNFTATTISKTRIDLTWMKGANADKTYIERNSLSSWTIGTGSFIYYNTGSSYSDIGLIENTHYYYQAWSWNQTDGFNLNSANADNTTFANQPPFFGSPIPSNSSTNNPLSLTWSIAINDPNGNTFSWTIECSNTQKNNGTAAFNGTKSLTLTGLVYSKTYKVWVNATDPTGSGLYSRKWYTFITRENSPPGFGTPTPTNGSTGNLLSLTWSIPINDPQGDTFTWTIQCNNTQVNTGSGTSNGTKTLTLTGLTNLTTYKIWVNATNLTGSSLYTRKWYTFTTKQNLQPNKPSLPSSQAIGKIKEEYSYTTSTTDPDGDKVYYLWDWGDGTTSGRLGPYNSGATCQANHTWNAKGNYNIQVKAKDIYGAESSWSDPLPIKIRNLFNYLILQFLEWLFQRFPNAFPILRQLLGY